jgi:hypothetical protein
MRAAPGAHAGGWHSGQNHAVAAPTGGETASEFNAANRAEAAAYHHTQVQEAAAKHRAAVAAANAKLKAARTKAAAEAKRRGLKGKNRTAFINEQTAKLKAARDAIVHGTKKAAVSELVKVGPKGYVHGWVFVGAPGVGAHVFHPRHGHGEISRVDEHGHAHVRFANGKTRSFEHVASSPGGHGGLTRRSEVGNDKFTEHLHGARAANTRGDRAAAAEHYRQAADATTHPAIREDMQTRAARDTGRAEAAAHTPEHNAAVDTYRANNQRKIDRATAERDAATNPVVRDIKQQQVDRLNERNRNAHQVISDREAKASRRAERATPTATPQPGGTPIDRNFTPTHDTVWDTNEAARRRLFPRDPVAQDPNNIKRGQIVPLGGHGNRHQWARVTDHNPKRGTYQIMEPGSYKREVSATQLQEHVRRNAAERAEREATASAGGSQGFIDRVRSDVRPSPSEAHLSAAEQALRNGDRAGAINHLTAAANAAPDAKSRAAIVQRRSELAAQVMHGTAARRPPKVSPQKTRATAERRRQKDALQREFDNAQRAATSRAA